jgi:hypothetical protein
MVKGILNERDGLENYFWLNLSFKSSVIPYYVDIWMTLFYKKEFKE